MEFNVTHDGARREAICIYSSKKTHLVPETLDVIMEIFAHSMNALATGLMPEENWLNQKIPGAVGYIAGGWKAVLTRVRGDWEFFSQVFRIPRWDNAVSM